MTNDETAYRYFLAKGLTPAQAAGVVGNLLQESNVDPASHTGVSDGVGQWEAPRWSTLLRWAGARNPRDLQTQLDFVWYELNSAPFFGLAQLKAATDVASATRAFQNYYERPGTPNEPRRIQLAMDTLAKYGSPPAPKTYPVVGEFVGKILVPLAIAAGLAYYLRQYLVLPQRRRA